MTTPARPEQDPVEALLAAYGTSSVADAAAAGLPSRENVARVCEDALNLLFPGYFSGGAVPREQLPEWTRGRLAALDTRLRKTIQGVLGFADVGTRSANDLAHAGLERLVHVRGLVLTDVEAAFANDPAACDRATVILSYPCIEALAIQRFAHELYRIAVPILPRMMTEWVHSRTGIDIHPGASIGESCFIDHGTGVVIGETSRLGKHCVLYQGVGLVAWNPLAKDEHGELRRGQSNKRHPDLEDHVTIYAGATILGGDTVIGHHSVIGGSVWLTHSVPPASVVTIKDPELVIRPRGKRG